MSRLAQRQAQEAPSSSSFTDQQTEQQEAQSSLSQLQHQERQQHPTRGSPSSSYLVNQHVSTSSSSLNSRLMSLSTFQPPLPGYLYLFRFLIWRRRKQSSSFPPPISGKWRGGFSREEDQGEEGASAGQKPRSSHRPVWAQVQFNKLNLFDSLLLSDVLIQKSEGYILEAPKAEKEDFAGPSMDTIFKGLAEAKQKEENFKKRQVNFDSFIQAVIWMEDATMVNR